MSRANDAVFHKGAGEPRPEWFEMRFAENGWTGAWRDGVFDYHHFHVTTHEVLAAVPARPASRSAARKGPSTISRRATRW